MTKYVYLDIETTGLNPERNDIVEIAWAVDDYLVRSIRPPHRLFNAAPEALEINKYHERFLSDKTTWASTEDIADLYTDLTDATIVGANPTFDVSFLRRLFGGDTPWHHRLLDVEAYAHGVFRRHGRLWGLRQIRDELVSAGFTIPAPDHTAARDVEVVRQVLKVLEMY